MKNISFNKQDLQGKELEYIRDALKDCHVSGDGSFTQKASSLLERKLNVAKALITTSCTHALEMTALLMNLKPGNEVIIPSFTFVSTVNAFVLRGIKPVFADIRRDTLNLDESLLERLINQNTKAIVPVHYAGVACELNEIIKIAKKNKLYIIEDNAHGLFGKYRNKYLGTFGNFSTLSFHETKNFSCGEGGALLINDEKYIKRAEIIREKGTNRSEFFRGQVDKYSWVDIGSSYLPSDILAAFLYAQLEVNKSIQNKRKEIWNYYFNNLKDWAHSNNIRLPFVPDHCDQSYHMFYIILPSLQERTRFIIEMKKMNINCVFHYTPLNDTPMGNKFGWVRGDCPVSEDLSDRIVRLPFYNNLFPDINFVINNILKFKI